MGGVWFVVLTGVSAQEFHGRDACFQPHHLLCRAQNGGRAEARQPGRSDHLDSDADPERGRDLDCRRVVRSDDPGLVFDRAPAGSAPADPAAFAGAAALFITGVIIINLDAALGALGRDTTLTGRTDIWPYVLHMSAERPILGYGYAAFWEMEAFARHVLDRFQWSVPTAHNGYLDILLGLGGVGVGGLGLTLAFILSMGFRLIARFRRFEPGVVVFALPSLAYYLLFNLVESAFFNSSGLSWIIMVITFLLLTPGLAAIKEKAR